MVNHRPYQVYDTFAVIAIQSLVSVVTECERKPRTRKKTKNKQENNKQSNRHASTAAEQQQQPHTEQSKAFSSEFPLLPCSYVPVENSVGGTLCPHVEFQNEECEFALFNTW